MSSERCSSTPIHLHQPGSIASAIADTCGGGARSHRGAQTVTGSAVEACGCKGERGTLVPDSPPHRPPQRPGSPPWPVHVFQATTQNPHHAALHLCKEKVPFRLVRHPCWGHCSRSPSHHRLQPRSGREPSLPDPHSQEPSHPLFLRAGPRAPLLCLGDLDMGPALSHQHLPLCNWSRPPQSGALPTPPLQRRLGSASCPHCLPWQRSSPYPRRSVLPGFRWSKAPGLRLTFSDSAGAAWQRHAACGLQGDSRGHLKALEREDHKNAPQLHCPGLHSLAGLPSPRY